MIIQIFRALQIVKFSVMKLCLYIATCKNMHEYELRKLEENKNVWMHIAH